MKKSGNAYKMPKPNKRSPKAKMTMQKKTTSKMYNRLKPGSKKR